MTTSLGQQAETIAADYLRRQGFKIVDRNWRTRWCEVDLIAVSSAGIHFIEVKHRKRSDFGSGFDYITRSKQQRLRRAAAAWMAAHGDISSYQLDAVSVSGQLADPRVEYLANVVIDS
jgi:uncharacterized protein (TIGR00252 family)